MALDSIERLKRFNSWRRGDGSPQGNPNHIGEDIDEVIKVAERYEFIRLLNPRQYQELWMEALNGVKTFDALVDERMAKK